MKPLLFLLAFPASLLAQDSSFVLMGLAAHPDDEDGATLAYYAKLKGAKVYSLVFTRGEGGQNEIGSSLYDDLAEIRTAETLEAAKRIGAETFFLDFRDFGYSKTAAETFKLWGGKREVLARLVYFIRKLRPDVIITNHDTLSLLPFRQHGHHQAVGVSAFEAFEKAADSTFCPEQLRDGVGVWQPKKLFFRLLRPDDRSHPLWRDSLVEIDVGAKLDSATTVLRLAQEALAQHRSQGMDKLSPQFAAWFNAPRRFLLVRSDRSYPFVKDDLFAGVSRSRRAAISLDDIAEKPPPFSLKVYPQVLLKAVASEEELVKEKSPRYSRQLHLALRNRTGEILPVALSISLDGKPIFRKAYLFSGAQLAEIRDSISLSLEKDSRFVASELLIEAKPLGVVAETRALAPVSRRALLKPVQAKRKENMLVGLVKTYDSTLEEFFSAFGIPFALLDSSRLASENLKRYSAIVLDLRAYGFRSDLAQRNARILDYAKNGGNVICFYHKPQDWNDKGFSPYPIFLAQERVAEEDAPVKPLLPAHPIFHFPNEIVDADWQGWVQERSVYLPSAETDKTSPKYLRLLAMSDSNEVQPSTSLLWAKVGKGTYTYCSLALYRQLRVLHNGAAKLLLNLLGQ